MGEMNDGAGGEPRAELRWANFNSYAAIAFVALGIAMFILIPYEIEKPMIIMGQSLNALDPTLFPKIVAASFVGLGLWFFWKSRWIGESQSFTELDREAWVNVSVTFAALIAYATLMEPIGFVPSSALLVGGLSVFYGARNAAIVGAICLGVPIATYYLFTRALKVSLPEIPDL